MNYETRYWGDFRCHSCNRKWSSAATWKGRFKNNKNCPDKLNFIFKFVEGQDTDYSNI